MSVRRQFIAGFSWNTLTVVLQVVIQLVYTGILARLIPESSFALMGIVLSIMGFAEIFSQIGIGPAIIQRKTWDQGHINAAFYSSVILGLGFTLAFQFAAGFISRMYSITELERIIQVVCSSFTISALAVIPRSLMIREMRFRHFFKASMVSIVGGNLVIGLGLAALGYGVWAYIWALFAQNALMTISLWYYQPVKVTFSWKWSFTKELMSYGVGSTMFNALNYLATKLDVTLIPLFMQTRTSLPQTEQLRLAAMYERSNYVMSQPITIIGKLSDNVLFSGMSRIQDEHERLGRTIGMGTNVLACLTVPASVFMFFYSPEIIRVYLGEKFNDAAPVLAILFAAVVFRTLSRLGDSLVRAKGAVYTGTWIKAVYVILMAAGIVITVPMGMNWVAMSIVITTFIHYLMSAAMVSHLIHYSWGESLRSLIPSALISIPVLLACFLSQWISHTWLLPAIPSLVLGAIACVLFPVLLIMWWPAALGPERINPLHILPEKLQTLPLVRTMIRRLKKPEIR